MSLRFFTAALSILASAASLVTAAPTAAVPDISPKNFASTGWGGASHAKSGLRVYYPTAGGIQELVAKNGGLAAHDQKWTKGAFLSDPTFEVDDTAPIAAANTYFVREDEIHVVFLSNDNNIRSWEYSSGSWKKGSLVSGTPDFRGSLTANAYKTPSAGVKISAFYSHGDGMVEELQRNADGNWQFLGQVGKINDGVEFTSMVAHNQDNVNKHIFTADNQVLRWTTQIGKWTDLGGQTEFNAVNLAVVNLGNNNLKFFAAHGNPNPSVTQWTMDQGAFLNDPTVIAKVVQTSGSPVSAAAQRFGNKTWIYVFYLGTGSHLRCAMYDGTKWYVDDERVDALTQ